MVLTFGNYRSLKLDETRTNPGILVMKKIPNVVFSSLALLAFVTQMVHAETREEREAFQALEKRILAADDTWLGGDPPRPPMDTNRSWVIW